jgi:hypothetical protein
VVAAPAAAAQPARTRYVPSTGPIPAGTACSFEVLRQILPGAHDVYTEYSDGRSVLNAHGDVVLTNAETGASFVHHAAFNSPEWFDPSTGLIRGMVNGSVLQGFWPGDAGPYGVVGAPGALYRFVGTIWYAYDPDTYVTVEFRYQGTITDICALLA